MKNFKLLLVAAVVFGAGSAFTTVEKYQAETVYNDAGVWRPIPPGFRVDCENVSGFCTGTGTISNPQPTSKRGRAHLVEL